MPEQLDAIPVTQRYFESAPVGETLFMADNCHPTVVGYQIIAEIIGEELIARKLIPTAENE